jgi:hypothetical protein
MFVHAKHAGGEPSFIAIDDKHTVSLEGEIDPSVVNAPAWAEAMWCAMAVGDGLSQEWLSTVNVKDLAPPGVAHGRYVYALGEFLRSLVTHDGHHGSWLIRATEQCNDRVDTALVGLPDWVDDIDYPTLRTAYYALNGDAENFNAALADLLESHRRYWSATERALAVDGLISPRACALARMATALGLPVEVESAYMPTAIWHAETHRQLRCPYCVGPLPEGAPACALCGNTLRDAPLELTQTTSSSEHVPCKTCAYPLHRFAVVCPQCRTQRRSA